MRERERERERERKYATHISIFRSIIRCNFDYNFNCIKTLSTRPVRFIQKRYFA